MIAVEGRMTSINTDSAYIYRVLEQALGIVRVSIVLALSGRCHNIVQVIS